jgi:oligopeptide/dipeptide ABC transporter ATP-binding protein
MKMPYTEALLKSIPTVEARPAGRLPVIEGRLPDPTDRPAGCGFAPRCSYAQTKCHDDHPPLIDAGNGHLYRCWFPLAAPARRS